MQPLEGLLWCWISQPGAGAGVAGVSFIAGGQEAEVVPCLDGVRGGTAPRDGARGVCFSPLGV